MESLEAQELHQQMDMIYQQHEQELKKHLEELQGVDEKLIKRKMEVEQEEKRLLAAKESLALEREEIAKKQEELKQYQERIEKELERIRQEKNNSDLWKKSETVETGAEERFKENSKNIEAGEGLQKQLNEQKKEEQDVETKQQTESRQPQELEIDIQPQAKQSMHEWNKDTEELPDLIKQFVRETERIFPDGEVLEITPESYCMSIEDKELRIFAGSPPTAMILAKREKNPLLIKGIAQLNRVQPDWEFTHEGNYLKCVMPFTEAVPAEIVLQKCAEAIGQYFK